jgi:hypothetical protein
MRTRIGRALSALVMAGLSMVVAADEVPSAAPIAAVHVRAAYAQLDGLLNRYVLVPDQKTTDAPAPGPDRLAPARAAIRPFLDSAQQRFAHQFDRDLADAATFVRQQTAELGREVNGATTALGFFRPQV